MIRRHRLASLALVGLTLVAGGTQAIAGPQASASADVVQPPPASELAPLPELEPIRIPDAEPGATKELDSILAQLTSEKEDIRDHARGAIDDTAASLLPAIHARIAELHGSYDKKGVPRVLEDARKAARAKRKSGAKDAKDDPPAHDLDKPKKKKKKGKDSDKPKDNAKDKEKEKDKRAAADEDPDTGDWLGIVLDQAKPSDEAWRQLVELLAMERMLAAIGTTPAVMEIMDLRATFGDLLRIDIQRQMDRLGERAVPGLIESKAHKASVVRELAAKQLDKMGRAIPGEAVASDDPDILADVLRAFGHVRDVDAVHVALSYANSERRKLRDASRACIAGIGDAGKWQLREAYQDLTGDKPDKSASWDLLARQIFAIYDRARLAAFDKLVSDGMAAATAGNHAEAVRAFDQVLAEDPLFDKRKDMAASYSALAATLPVERGEEKLALFRKAARLDPDGKDGKRIESQIALTEAKLLIHDHRPDRFLLERAVELDPLNTEAKDLLASFEERAVEQKDTNKRRYVGAAAIFVGMLATVLAIGLWGRRKKPATATTPQKPTGSSVGTEKPVVSEELQLSEKPALSEKSES